MASSNGTTALALEWSGEVRCPKLNKSARNLDLYFFRASCSSGVETDQGADCAAGTRTAPARRYRLAHSVGRDELYRCSASTIQVEDAGIELDGRGRGGKTSRASRQLLS